MGSGTLTNNIDWGTVALLVIVATGLVGGFVFLLRQNRKDLDSLQETLDSASEDEAK